MGQRLIIDTDPGVDDMFAILAALNADGVDLRGITTVGGNVPIGTTTRNALRILARVHRQDVQVYAGLSATLTAEEVHGGDGLSGCPWPDSRVPAQAEPAIDYLARELAGGHTTLACLGPLTNIAALLQAHPDLTGKIERIVLMGGGFGTYSFRAGNGIVESRGNVTPVSEFNIYADIGAAQSVFASGIPITVVPLDVTHRTLVSRERLARLMPDVAGILDRYAAFSRKKWGHDAAPLHDPNVIARIAEPDLYSGLTGTVSVTASGQTVLESGSGPHEVLVRVDAEGFLDWVWERLAEAGL